MSHEHILVVEDDDSLRTGIVDLLEYADYQVSAARDGAAALDMLQQMPDLPNLIVSDIRMPRLDGYELLDAVRDRPQWVAIPFIFLSAKGDKQDVRRGKLRGADDYISKPFEFEDLLVAIESSLSRHRQLNAAQEARLDTIKHSILHIINHEFRTPLMYIVSYADLLADVPEFQHSEELRTYIEAILLGGERLSRLVENFLTLAEMESGMAGKIYEQRRGLIDDFENIVEGAVDELEQWAGERQQDIRLTVVEPLPKLNGDRTYLKLALREILHNAIRFTPQKGIILVMVHYDRETDAINVEVCDNGPGIPPEEHERLFETFYQVNRADKEQGGAGAGLAIAQHVAALHGGWLTVDSEPGNGSCFDLYLPVTRSENNDGTGR